MDHRAVVNYGSFEISLSDLSDLPGRYIGELKAMKDAQNQRLWPNVLIGLVAAVFWYFVAVAQGVDAKLALVCIVFSVVLMLIAIFLGRRYLNQKTRSRIHIDSDVDSRSSGQG